jgi:hypothetical protein
MATIIQVIKEDTFTQVTFRSASDKEYRLLLNKTDGTAIVYTDYIKHMNYGYSKTGNAYRVYTGTIEGVIATDLDTFLDQFK